MIDLLDRILLFLMIFAFVLIIIENLLSLFYVKFLFTSRYYPVIRFDEFNLNDKKLDFRKLVKEVLEVFSLQARTYGLANSIQFRRPFYGQGIGNFPTLFCIGYIQSSLRQKTRILKLSVKILYGPMLMIVFLNLYLLIHTFVPTFNGMYLFGIFILNGLSFRNFFYELRKMDSVINSIRLLYDINKDMSD